MGNGSNALCEKTLRRRKRGNNKMKELKHYLLTNRNTIIFHEDPEEMKYGAPHNFTVHSTEKVKSNSPQPFLEAIHFQEGPVKECGINGVTEEDLIAMVICRLQYFQLTEYSCRENSTAIRRLEEALYWLGEHTRDRERRGVEGTSAK